MKYYVEYSQTIVFRAPIEASSLEEAKAMFDEDRVNYNAEEIVGSGDDFEVIDIYEEEE